MPMVSPTAATLGAFAQRHLRRRAGVLRRSRVDRRHTGAEARAAWVKTLDAMAARKPAVVVPGHMAPERAMDASAIRYTRDYLVAFEEELAKAADSAALIAAMTKRYPNAGMGVALQIGAKVAKGEMKWG